jgi:hypothetical protein
MQAALVAWVESERQLDRFFKSNGLQFDPDFPIHGCHLSLRSSLNSMIVFVSRDALGSPAG